MKRFEISISIQIFIFLIIIAFTPIAIMISLETYEKQQLTMLENSNVQQGRLISSALVSNNPLKIDKEFALEILNNMENRFDSRIRILDSNGNLIADSSSLDNSSENEKSAVRYRSSVSETTENTDTFVYRLFSFPVRVYRKYFKPPRPSYDNADFYTETTVFDGPEVAAARNGKYGAITRFSTGGQVSVTLYSALPVQKNGNIFGVVLVSRSTYRILQNLYELRVDLGKIFLRSLLVVLLIAFFLAFRIVHPLRKLSKQAGICADKKGQIIFTKFTGSKRHDEIGRLSRAFSNLIERLNQRIKFSQAFSSDISHEFKNPLTAIRSSAELLEDKTLTEEERHNFTAAIIDEVTHLQTLLTEVRNISKIDADIAKCQELPANTYVKNIISRIQKNYADTNVEFSSSAEEINIAIPPEYLEIVASNLIDNACSFADNVLVKTECSVSVPRRKCRSIEPSAQTKKESSMFILTVEDDGPGLCDEQIQKIFNRFYSERNDENKTNHTGLGLSLVKAVTDSLEGQITVSKSQKGGAKFSFAISIK